MFFSRDSPPPRKLAHWPISKIVLDWIAASNVNSVLCGARPNAKKGGDHPEIEIMPTDEIRKKAAYSVQAFCRMVLRFPRKCFGGVRNRLQLNEIGN
jgi:hypothetical protein